MTHVRAFNRLWLSQGDAAIFVNGHVFYNPTQDSLETPTNCMAAFRILSEAKNLPIYVRYDLWRVIRRLAQLFERDVDCFLQYSRTSSAEVVIDLFEATNEIENFATRDRAAG